MGLADRLWGQDLQKKSISDISEEINTIIRDVTGICPSARVLIFGSYAAKTSNSGSDLDMAIILPDDFNKKSFKKDFYKKRTRIQIPVDFIFRNETEFRESKIENPIDNEIHQKGIELYPHWNFHD
jgi:predicted nucleotidyltransferase